MSQRSHEEGKKVQQQHPADNAFTNNITRRCVLTRLTVAGSAGLVATTSLSSSLFASTGRSNACAQNLSLAEWRRLVGHRFTTQGSQSSHTQVPKTTTFILEEVNENSQIERRDLNRPAGLRPASLSLLFSSDRDLTSATYVFENSTIGRNSFFVHPVRRDDRKHQQVFEVVLN